MYVVCDVVYIYTRVYCMCCVCAACALCKPTSVCFFCVCVCELPIVVLFVLGCLLKTLILWQKNQEHNRSVRTVCLLCVCMLSVQCMLCVSVLCVCISCACVRCGLPVLYMCERVGVSSK